jgi:hypothetical protein
MYVLYLAKRAGFERCSGTHSGMQRPQYLKYVRKDIVKLEKIADFPVKGSERKSSVFFFKMFSFSD